MNKDYIEDMIQKFKDLKALCEKAIDQLPDEHFFSQLDGESNSVAIILKHIGGSMASRWTDFLTTDGEKPNRQRDGEFIVENDSKERILECWERGWRATMDTLNSLNPSDLSKTVFTRTKPQSALQSINQILSHCSLHIGQIIFLSKHFASDHWTSLTIPKGESEQFNRKMMGEES